MAARAYLLRQNTLEHSGHWVATKTTLEKGVMGAFSFMRGRQSLERRRLNLGAWFGFQELLYKTPLRLAAVEFDFALNPKAYVCLIFDKTARGFSGFRLSLNERFPSLYFTASDAGEFLSRTPLKVPALRPRAWSHATLAFASDGFALTVEGADAGRFQTPLPATQTVGFRGGRRIALVDNVVFRQRDEKDPLRPTSTTYESFDSQDQGWIAAGVIAAVLALNALGFALGRRRSPDRTRELALLGVVANGVGLALASLLLGYLTLTAGRYPAADAALKSSEDYWRRSTADEIRSDIPRRYGAPPGTGTTRVLFLGSSQTWGAGAARKGETFVEVSERLLNEKQAGRFECINGGISAADSTFLLDILRKEWLRLEPKVVVINLSNNDGDPEVLRKNVAEMVRVTRAARAEPILVLEPNTSEDPGGDLDLLATRHGALRAIGAALHVTVVDMQAHLAENQDRGFLWWDSVHLTSFGQRLFAERLAPEVRRACEALRLGL